MNSKTIRNWAFGFHRYHGLIAGLIISIVGLTGSLLVFLPELTTAQLKNNLPKIVPQVERIPLEILLQQVETELQAEYPNFREITELVVSEYRFFDLDEPVYFIYEDDSEDFHQIFVDPYTAEIIGDETDVNFDFWDNLREIHINLLAGTIGTYFVGITGLFTTLLCLTGILMWSGWRKLISGFKIKWNGHIKRRNFDLHKVVGIVVSIFLAAIAFTGFCWNLEAWSMPVIYSVTFSKPSPADRGIDIPIISSPPSSFENSIGLFGKHFPEMLKIANANFPGGMFSNGYIDTDFLGVVTMVQCYLQRNTHCGVLEFDKYSGALIRTWELDKGVSLGDKIVTSFPAIHFGTFGGFSTRILYVFVGLSPSILFVTGSIMYRYRRREPKVTQIPKKLIKQ